MFFIIDLIVRDLWDSNAYHFDPLQSSTNREVLLVREREVDSTDINCIIVY